jgi:galactose oxidase-like protein
MGLRIISLGNRTVALGGFDYAAQKCLRSVSILNTDGSENELRIQLAVGRNHFETVPLDRDRLLVFGGYSEDYDTLAEVECLDLRRKRVEAWPWLDHPVELCTAIPLPGTVAVIGGLTSQGQTKAWDSIQLIDLKTHEVSEARAKLKTSRFGHDSLWLPTLAKVLIAGGKHVERVNGKSLYTAVRSLELWDPNADTIEPAGEMTVARDRPRLALLKSGKVLIVGGASDLGSQKTIELYDPATKTSSVLGTMAAPRMAASVLDYLGKGLIIAGGWTSDPQAGTAIEYLDYQTLQISTIGHARTCRAENAMVWLKPDEFALIGGKDMFEGRRPEAYSFRETERFKVQSR